MRLRGQSFLAILAILLLVTTAVPLASLRAQDSNVIISLAVPTFAADPRVALVAAADPRAEARRRFAAEFAAKTYANVEDLCADPLAPRGGVVRIPDQPGLGLPP